MRLKTDENLGLNVVETLRQAGHDVLSVAGQAFKVPRTAHLLTCAVGRAEGWLRWTWSSAIPSYSDRPITEESPFSGYLTVVLPMI